MRTKLLIGLLAAALMTACTGTNTDAARLRTLQQTNVPPVSTPTPQPTIAPTATALPTAFVQIVTATETPSPIVAPVEPAQLMCVTLTVEATQQAIGVYLAGKCWREGQP